MSPTLAADIMLFYVGTYLKEFLNYSPIRPATPLYQPQHRHSKILTVQKNIFSHLAETVCLFANSLEIFQYSISANELITKPLRVSLGDYTRNQISKALLLFLDIFVVVVVTVAVNGTLTHFTL